MFNKITISGLGLLGGSIALAAREQKLAQTIIAHGRRIHEGVVESGLVDFMTTEIDEACHDADLVILCAPVDTIKCQIPQFLDAASSKAILTDVGSTKLALAQTARDHSNSSAFIGSHPMVGSHLTGWKNARSDLFRNGLTYVTTDDSSDLERAAKLGSFWRALESRVMFVDPERHDYLCSLVSHTPHMAAVALVEMLGLSKEDENLLKNISGKGLRDTTRVAMGSPEVWDEILSHNHHNIARQLDVLSGLLKEMAAEIREDPGAIKPLLERAAELRKKLNK